MPELGRICAGGGWQQPSLPQMPAHGDGATRTGASRYCWQTRKVSWNNSLSTATSAIWKMT
jgi:hypothetical protein